MHIAKRSRPGNKRGMWIAQEDYQKLTNALKQMMHWSQCTYMACKDARNVLEQAGIK